MRRARRIALSSAVTTGVLGVAGVAAAAMPGISSAAPTPSTGQSADQVAAERLVLQQALTAIEGRTRALGADLSVAQAQLAAERRALAAEAAASRLQAAQQAATAARSAMRNVVYVQAPDTTTPAPVPHATTGASGSAGTDDLEGDGGSDD